MIVSLPHQQQQQNFEKEAETDIFLFQKKRFPFYSLINNPNKARINGLLIKGEDLQPRGRGFET